MSTRTIRPYWQDLLDGSAGSARRDLGWPMVILLGLLAGGLGVLVFQEGTLYLLHHHGASSPLLVALFGHVPRPFSVEPGWPLGLPHLTTEVLWGAGWGVALAALICRGQPLPALATGAFLGVALIMVFVFAVGPLLGSPEAVEGTRRQAFQLGLLLAAGWGWGTALLLKLVTRR